MDHRKSFGKAVDPVLGINLEGGLLCDDAKQVSSLTDHGQHAIHHDLEDVALVGEEGKKRSRRESDDLSKTEELNSPARNRRLMDLNHLSSAVPRGKPTGHYENNKLECLWIGESTDS